MSAAAGAGRSHLPRRVGLAAAPALARPVLPAQDGYIDQGQVLSAENRALAPTALTRLDVGAWPCVSLIADQPIGLVVVAGWARTSKWKGLPGWRAASLHCQGRAPRPACASTRRRTGGSRPGSSSRTRP